MKTEVEIIRSAHTIAEKALAELPEHAYAEAVLVLAFMVDALSLERGQSLETVLADVKRGVEVVCKDLPLTAPS